MKKSPCPAVMIVPDTDSSNPNRVVLQFEWETISFQMYDDEALRLAREIHDALQGQAVSAWNRTHRSTEDGSDARFISFIEETNNEVAYFTNEDGLIFSDEIARWEAID